MEAKDLTRDMIRIHAFCKHASVVRLVDPRVADGFVLGRAAFVQANESYACADHGARCGCALSVETTYPPKGD